MRLMIASDIHGSAHWCRALLDRYESERPDKLILLGDILYHGPRNPLPDGYDPARTAEMLNLIKDNILCVRGNCDSEVDGMVLQFPVTADSLLILLGNRTALCTHGHLFDPENAAGVRCGDILISGHTHIYGAEEKNGITYLNPGSVSMPKNGNVQSYGILTENFFEILDMQGGILCKYSFV